MAAPDITFQLLDGKAAPAEELQAVYADVYAARNEDPVVFADRFRVQRRQPGFVVAEARSGGYMVGYAAGMPLRPSTSWWRDLTSPLPDDFTTEHPGRTFALAELAVRASWRKQGIGHTLLDLILGSRREERATVVLPPSATAAMSAFQSWGWRKVGRTRDPGANSLVSDVLVLAL